MVDITAYRHRVTLEALRILIPKEKASSCKFFGDDLQLCGNLLGEPQLFPLLVKFHHF